MRKERLKDNDNLGAGCIHCHHDATYKVVEGNKTVFTCSNANCQAEAIEHLNKALSGLI